MKIIQTLLVLLGGLFPFILNAGTTEDIYFSHIGMEDGLSHSTIFAINQDKEGNLWFANHYVISTRKIRIEPQFF